MIYSLGSIFDSLFTTRSSPSPLPPPAISEPSIHPHSLLRFTFLATCIFDLSPAPNCLYKHSDLPEYIRELQEGRRCREFGVAVDFPWMSLWRSRISRAKSKFIPVSLVVRIMFVATLDAWLVNFGCQQWIPLSSFAEPFHLMSTSIIGSS